MRATTQVHPGGCPYRELFAAFALLHVQVFAACANFPVVVAIQNGDFARAMRRALSFRPKGEIFVRSLAFARDDGPWPITLRPLREIFRVLVAALLRQDQCDCHNVGEREIKYESS